jgi:hypothetical protein
MFLMGMTDIANELALKGYWYGTSCLFDSWLTSSDIHR